MPTKTKRSATPKPTMAAWWKNTIMYQIYVRSFYDSNGDGVGDIPGIIEKLDYIESLGVNTIWLSPVTVSANADWGYDVKDYYNIDPVLGTLSDYDELISECRKRGLRVLMDLVPNHTSTAHPWFQNAITGKNSEFRDYYLWADPKRDGSPPSNWRAYGGGSAWEYHSKTGQYYLHSYFKAQADLNWRNPAVVDEFDKIMRFWLERGISGFRLDVFNVLIKDINFRDNPKPTREDGIESMILGMRPLHNLSQPEVHDVLKRWRRTIDEYGGLLLGETAFIMDFSKVIDFYGEDDEIQLIMNLGFLHSQFGAAQMRPIVETTEAILREPNWPLWHGSNHDEKRFPSNWAQGDERKIRCAMMMLLCLRGTPILYYGDELGMQRVFVAPWRMKDPRGRRNWPVDGGRDRYRTPMQWKHQVGAGFTGQNVRPWLPYGDLKIRSAENQEQTPDSTLRFTRAMIALRKENPDLQSGRYETLPTAISVWAWRRGDGIIVVLNLSNHHHQIKQVHGEILLGTLRKREGDRVLGLLHLAPWEGVVVKTQ